MGDVREVLATEIDVLVKGLKIVTRCATVDELVTRLSKFCTPTTCFIPTRDRRRVGIETLFSLRLADGTVVVRGLCVVREVWSTGDNPFGRPGIDVTVLKISDDTRPVYDRMLARVPVPVEPGETERVDSRAEMQTIDMPPALPDDCTIAEDPDARAPTEVDAVEPFPPIGDPAVDAPRGEIATLIGVTPADGRAPHYVASEPVAVKLPSPIQLSWWRRLVRAVRELITRPKRRQRRHREKIAALPRPS